MKLRLSEHTAVYHSQAANLAFSNGKVLAAVSHVRAAFHVTAASNRSGYLNTVSKWLNNPNDVIWHKQANSALSKILAAVLNFLQVRKY